MKGVIVIVIIRIVLMAVILNLRMMKYYIHLKKVMLIMMNMINNMLN